MTAPNLSSLLLRVESAEGGDRELDTRLYVALTEGERGEHLRALIVARQEAFPDQNVWLLGAGDWQVPRYTASLDAALALVERVLPGWERHVRILSDSDTVAGVVAPGPDFERLQTSTAKTPALALIAALLKALVAEGDNAPIGAPWREKEGQEGSSRTDTVSDEEITRRRAQLRAGHAAAKAARPPTRTSDSGERT